MSFPDYQTIHDPLLDAYAETTDLNHYINSLSQVHNKYFINRVNNNIIKLTSDIGIDVEHIEYLAKFKKLEKLDPKIYLNINYKQIDIINLLPKTLKYCIINCIIKNYNTLYTILKVWFKHFKSNLTECKYLFMFKSYYILIHNGLVFTSGYDTTFNRFKPIIDLYLEYGLIIIDTHYNNVTAGSILKLFPDDYMTKYKDQILMYPKDVYLISGSVSDLLNRYLGKQYYFCAGFYNQIHHVIVLKTGRMITLYERFGDYKLNKDTPPESIYYEVDLSHLPHPDQLLTSIHNFMLLFNCSPHKQTPHNPHSFLSDEI